MNLEPLPTWPRPQYAEGGYSPYVKLCVYGDIALDRTLSRGTYRCEGVPDLLRLVELDRAQQADGFHAPWHPPLGTLLEESLPGVRKLLQRAPRCVDLSGEIADGSTLNYLRDTIGLITWLLDGGGEFVLDTQQFKCWSAAQWRDLFAAQTLQPQAHCVVLVSEDERPGRQWVHTRGLRLFGRPDVSLRGVPANEIRIAAQICQQFIEMQALGAVIADGTPVRIAGLPASGVARLGGHLDNPEFNNRHLEIAITGWAES